MEQFLLTKISLSFLSTHSTSKRHPFHIKNSHHLTSPHNSPHLASQTHTTSSHTSHLTSHKLTPPFRLTPTHLTHTTSPHLTPHPHILHSTPCHLTTHHTPTPEHATVKTHLGVDGVLSNMLQGLTCDERSHLHTQNTHTN
jgi:hypothetical protein